MTTDRTAIAAAAHERLHAQTSQDLSAMAERRVAEATSAAFAAGATPQRDRRRRARRRRRVGAHPDPAPPATELSYSHRLNGAYHTVAKR